MSGLSSTAEPTEFGQERAREITKEAKADGQRRGIPAFHYPMHNLLTDGERAYVLKVWHAMPGEATWACAFGSIRAGKPGVWKEVSYRG